MTRLMIRTVLCIAFVVLMGHGVSAQQPMAPLAKGFSLGFQLVEQQRDFGLGVNVLSPHFAKDRMALRLRANIMWNQHPTREMVTTWIAYPQLSLGVLGYGGTIAGRIRLYGEGGPMVLFPAQAFATSRLAWGGYGLFGFEFFMSPHFCYVLELGGVGSNARAERLAAKPIYANGFMVHAGFRYQF